MLKWVIAPTQIKKLLPNWEGPYQIHEKFLHGSYKLEEYDRQLILGTWNSMTCDTIRDNNYFYVNPIRI